MNSIQIAREAYRPDKIRCLFLAESPPACVERFFYYPDVRDKDSLFLEMMKVLYGADQGAPAVRAMKSEYLDRFKHDGFYLEDAMDEPIGESATARKIRKIQSHRNELLEKLSKIAGDSTPIILISNPVHEALDEFLREKGFNITNDEMIDFPGSGGQIKFREKMKKLLETKELD